MDETDKSSENYDIPDDQKQKHYFAVYLTKGWV